VRLLPALALYVLCAVCLANHMPGPAEVVELAETELGRASDPASKVASQSKGKPAEKVTPASKVASQSKDKPVEKVTPASKAAGQPKGKSTGRRVKKALKAAKSISASSVKLKRRAAVASAIDADRKKTRRESREARAKAAAALKRESKMAIRDKVKRAAKYGDRFVRKALKNPPEDTNDYQIIVDEKKHLITAKENSEKTKSKTPAKHLLLDAFSEETDKWEPPKPESESNLDNTSQCTKCNRRCKTHACKSWCAMRWCSQQAMAAIDSKKPLLSQKVDADEAKRVVCRKCQPPIADEQQIRWCKSNGC